MKRTSKRGAVSKLDAKAVIVWFPKTVLPLIDSAVAKHDTDRSKFIRAAVREKLASA